MYFGWANFQVTKMESPQRLQEYLQTSSTPSDVFQYDDAEDYTYEVFYFQPPQLLVCLLAEVPHPTHMVLHMRMTK